MMSRTGPAFDLGRIARDLRENATRFKVSGIGPNGLVEPIDVMSARLDGTPTPLRFGNCPPVAESL